MSDNQAQKSDMPSSDQSGAQNKKPDFKPNENKPSSSENDNKSTGTSGAR